LLTLIGAVIVTHRNNCAEKTTTGQCSNSAVFAFSQMIRSHENFCKKEGNEHLSCNERLLYETRHRHGCSFTVVIWWAQAVLGSQMAEANSDVWKRKFGNIFAPRSGKIYWEWKFQHSTTAVCV